MNEPDFELENRLSNDASLSPWSRVQIVLRCAGGLLQNNDRDTLESMRKEYYGRSSKSRFASLRHDKKIQLSLLRSGMGLVSESTLKDIVDSRTDILYMRMRTPELDTIAWKYCQAILERRDNWRSAGINLPIENDIWKMQLGEHSLRQGYLNSIWKNSLHMMSELGIKIPNWTKILPYSPMVNAMVGINENDRIIGERLLSDIEDRFPHLYSDLIQSNPFSSPLGSDQGWHTVGKGYHDHKFPSIFDIVTRIESGKPVDCAWEDSLIGSDNGGMDSSIDHDLEEYPREQYSLSDKLSALRQLAEIYEIPDAYSKNRGQLLSSLKEREDLIASIDPQNRRDLERPPRVSRLTDWTMFVKTNYPSMKKNLQIQQ